MTGAAGVLLTLMCRCGAYRLACVTSQRRKRSAVMALATNVMCRQYHLNHRGVIVIMWRPSTYPITSHPGVTTYNSSGNVTSGNVAYMSARST